MRRISRVGPLVSVVGDDRSGDPLHERCDESDVYKGEIAQVDVVPELVGWFDGVINGLRSLQNILSVIFNIISPPGERMITLNINTVQ